jgi:DNA-binding LacI/PurR family transcriptional regulator
MNLPVIPDISGRTPLYKQIEQAVRAVIVSGELPFGARLPTVQELARRYNTSAFTIQTALNALVEERLIACKRGRGIFVTGRSKQLRHVGVYFGRDIIHGRGMHFYRELNRILGYELRGRGIKHRFWIDGGGEDGQPMPEVGEAVSEGRIQGLIVGLCNEEELRWLRKLGVPLALFSPVADSCRVGLDKEQMLDLAAAEFKRQGCRSMGAILGFQVSLPDQRGDRQPADVRRFFDSFVNRMADAGLEIRNSWVRLPDGHLVGGAQEEFGYRQFQEIWNQSSRPDGLMVYPDTMVRGCVTAMMQCGVSVPGELKLVLHRQVGIPILCPLPAAWLVTDPYSIAAALITQLERTIRGETVEPVFVPQTLEPASSLEILNSPSKPSKPDSKYP